VQPPPGGNHQVEPHIVRVVGEAVPQDLEADLIVVHGPGRDHAEPLFGQRQPVTRLDPSVDVEIKVLLQKGTQGRERELSRVARESCRQRVPQ
jgi:hypothetical protein